MKKLLVLVFVISMALLAFHVYLFGVPKRVDASFATSAYLKYHYCGKAIDVKMKDSDLRVLKGMLLGFSYVDSPACGFDKTVSITLTNGRKSITICPACDSCGTFRIGNTDRYLEVSDEQRDRFEAIVKKYGMTFPCV